MSNEELQEFTNIIEEMKVVYRHDKRPWMIGFSGGKDSTLLCYLVFEMIEQLDESEIVKPIYIISSDTMVENPIVGNYMHDASEKIGKYGEKYNIISKVIYPKIENTFWSKIIGLGYPTPEAPGFRWCTQRLKIEPMNRFTLETISKSGEVVLLLGVRKDESVYRSNNIKSREIEGKLLIPHSDIAKAFVYNPLKETKNEVIWKYLLKNNEKSPWGTSMRYLFSLYQGEAMGEEQSVIGENDERKLPITGNSRFGCWICTMVKEDKSLKKFIDSGETSLVPLRDFRNRLLDLRNTPSAREYKRRNGAVYVKDNGELGQGPFTMEARKTILKELLELEVSTGFELITKDELKMIDRMWEKEGDLTRQDLVNIYYEAKGEHLPWASYKTAIYTDDVINEIETLCDENDLSFELISKLIIAIEENKNFTNPTAMTKAFDRVINQGWLHYDAIKEGFEEYED